MKRRTFSREFKIEAVKLVTERGAAVPQACRELELSERAAAVDARAGECSAWCAPRERPACRASRDRRIEKGGRPSRGGA
ncbi:transposase [Paracoccus sp. S-4012]|uniref:transposase n=1 Tax=Paracoccus sp. S-4012 TaxID=2665648 RepID=UPI00351BA40C